MLNQTYFLYLNYKFQNKVVMAASIQTTNAIINILRDFKKTEAEKYGIESLALVGSTARGEQQADSDIDICIKLRKTTFRIYMAIKEDLERRFNMKIDLITLHGNMRQLFRDNLEHDAIYI